MPTQADRERHVLGGHVQFRSWCSFCVKYRGRDSPHLRSGDNADKTYPILHWDYAYLSSTGGTPEEVEAEDLDAEKNGESPLLCLRDGKGKGLYPYLVPRKGTDFSLAEKLARQVCADLDRMAYSRVLFRSDNEASLNSFLRVIKQMGR